LDQQPAEQWTGRQGDAADTGPDPDRPCLLPALGKRAAGLIVFGVASAACGLAPSTGVLITGRVVQGIGAALLLPGTLAIIKQCR